MAVNALQDWTPDSRALSGEVVVVVCDPVDQLLAALRNEEQVRLCFYSRWV